MTDLEQKLRRAPYESYAYSYPHKSAYRVLEPPVRLADAWAAEQKDSLFLYLHVPFCEMRCGFCNLFTTANPEAEARDAYMKALGRQAEAVSRTLGGARFARMAVGGGTPTYLDPASLDSLFDIAARLFGADARDIPASCETSPLTAERDRLRVLRDRGVGRLSIGVQSFDEREARAAGRPQRTDDVVRALTLIREAGFPVLNIDLIYGLPGQSVRSWLASLVAALRFAPEELYLYPLYVRPLTGLERHPKEWDDIRLACYREGRALLLAEGYEQVSMRMFRAARAPAGEGPAYCCQDDGMVGIGCGARSYTGALHYSNEYAVGARGVREIIARYAACPPEEFGRAAYGFALDGAERRRRYVVKSLLRAGGLDESAYRERFGTGPAEDVPELGALAESGLAAAGASGLRLTDAGLELSDAVGPWLYSARVRELMRTYELH
ncbi:MAG TPA: STM4012 family radical SAM protein [Pyrinomonadaceae bacterium]|nr:STM4012 family radical SAM protein [Pyrinomonadaceae bacterium]